MEQKKKKFRWWYILIAIVAVIVIAPMMSGKEKPPSSPSTAGQTPQDDKAPLSPDEIAQMYTDPDAFKDRELTLIGKLLDSPEEDSDGTYFQMFAKPESSDWNTVVGYPNKDISLESDDYVKVVGVVDGVFKGENMMGGKVTAPRIVASTVEKLSYAEAVAPSQKTVDFFSTQTQLGYSVIVQKIEFAAKETRVYLSVQNDGSANFNVHGFNAKIVQNGKQYETESNYQADYPKVQTDLMPGVTTEGIFLFPTLDQAPFQLIIEGSSDNWDEKISPYVFDILVP